MILFYRVIAMELLQLKYFCEAAKCENFSKTAKKYMVPTSNVSQTIKRLEKELGKDLFIRSANKIKLNENGKIFYECVKMGLEKIEEGEKIISENSLRDEIRLNICTNRRIVTKAIEKFRKEYQDVTFYLSHNVETGEDFDFIIADSFFNAKDYDKKLLVDEDMYLAVSKTNPISKKSHLSADDLKKEQFVTMSSGSSIHKITHSICAFLGFDPNVIIQTDDPLYIRKYVELGLGITLFPAFSWKNQFSDNVSIKSISDFKRYIFVYQKKNKYISEASQKFLDTLISVCNDELL